MTAIEEIQLNMKTIPLAIKVLGITGIVLNTVFLIGTLSTSIHLWEAKMACTLATVFSAVLYQSDSALPCQELQQSLGILIYTTMAELSLELAWLVSCWSN